MAKPNDATCWDLRALQIFSRVSSSGSITKVAIDLGVSQPAISRYLSLLEKQCGGYLFTRTGRGVALTELGKQIQPAIERVLASANELNNVVAAAHGRVAGLVRIGTLPSLSEALIVPLLLRLHREYPGISVQIVESAAGQIESGLSQHEIDIGLPYRSHTALTSDEDVLLRLPSYLVGPPGDQLTAAPEIPFTKLNGVPLVLSRKPSSVRMMLDEMGRRHGVDINVLYEADSGFIQKQMVMKRVGYTLLPWHFIAGEVERGELQASEIVQPQVVRVVSLMVTQRSTPAVRVVVDLLREVVNESLCRFKVRPPGNE